MGPQEKQDRRIFERFPASFPVKFKDSRNDSGTSVFLRDASASGVKITTQERIYLNDSVSLSVELPDGSQPLSLRGSVVWTKSQNSAHWDIGLKFFELDLMHIQRLFKFCQ